MIFKSKSDLGHYLKKVTFYKNMTRIVHTLIKRDAEIKTSW